MLLTFLLWIWDAATASPDGLIHITLGGSTAALVSLRILEYFQRRTAGKNGNGNGIKRCGTEELIYWERMKDNVTQPICDAIRDQNPRGRGAGA